MEQNQGYRANVAAIIVNAKGEFLLTKHVESREEEWDFVKGGMEEGEEHVDTLRREITEELGVAVVYEVLQRSDVAIIYDWSKETQQRRGFRGPARISYWVLYKEGTITIQQTELSKYEWFSEEKIVEVLLVSGFPKIIVENFMQEWKNVTSLRFSSSK